MDAKYSQDARKLEVLLNGDLDAGSSPEFEKEISAKLDDIDELLIDMADVGYISSAGIRVLLYLQRIMAGKGKLLIRNPSEMVDKVFEMTGLKALIEII